MVKNSVLLLLHPSKWHVKEQGRFKTKKYDHQVRDPVWLLAITKRSYLLSYYTFPGPCQSLLPFPTGTSYRVTIRSSNILSYYDTGYKNELYILV